MSTLLSQDELVTLVHEQKVIKNGVESCVEGNKYDLRFGGLFLKALHGKAENLVEVEKRGGGPEASEIKPGEVVYILTKEELNLPNNIKAELSLKRRVAHEGIIVLGGFCVDPLYSGPLVLGLYNITSRSWPLDLGEDKGGRKIIAAQFYRLTDEECRNAPTPTPLKGFPDDLRHIIKFCEGVSTTALAAQVQKLASEFAALREEVRDRESWIDTFREGLNQVKQLLADGARELDKERNERLAGVNLLSTLVADQKLLWQGLDKRAAELETARARHETYIGIAKWLSITILGGIVALYLAGRFL